MHCLNAMRKAFYSVFVAESVIPNVGITARDMVSDRRLFGCRCGIRQLGETGLVRCLADR